MSKLNDNLDTLDKDIQYIVFPPDGRKPVPNSSIFPFQSICKIYSTFQNGETYGGTGTKIGPNTILTAAHNIHYPGLGVAKRFVIIPGLDGGNTPFGTIETNFYDYPKRWEEQYDQKYDFGAIFLPHEINNISDINFTTIQDDLLNQNPIVTISGYPLDLPAINHSLAGTIQYFHTSNIGNISDYELSYFLDTEGGQSGSPVLYHVNDTFAMCAIHNRGLSHQNSATRIIPAIYQTIDQWKRNPVLV